MLDLGDAFTKFRGKFTKSVKRSNVSRKLRQQCDHKEPDRDRQTRLIKIELSTNNRLIRYIAKHVNSED